MVENNNIDNLKSDLDKGLKDFFKDVPYYYMFEDNDKEKIAVGWLNGPQKEFVRNTVKNIYERHGLSLNDFNYKRFFNLKGAEFVSKTWNDNFGRGKLLNAVGHKEIAVPSSISKDGKAFIPVFREGFDGFKDDRDRRFWQMALNSVIGVCEPDKVIEKMVRRDKKSEFGISVMI